MEGAKRTKDDVSQAWCFPFLSKQSKLTNSGKTHLHITDSFYFAFAQKQRHLQNFLPVKDGRLAILFLILFFNKTNTDSKKGTTELFIAI